MDSQAMCLLHKQEGLSLGTSDRRKSQVRRCTPAIPVLGGAKGPTGLAPSVSSSVSERCYLQD